jgi:hypothetical protein
MPKSKRADLWRKLARVKHEIQLGVQPTFTQALKALGFSGRINTAWISRVNLTIRRGVAALARRTWATALHTPHLQAHLNWWQASYHFVHPHASLRMSLGQPLEHEGKLRAQWYRQRTEALQPGEPRADGQRRRCSVARFHLSLLERWRSRESSHNRVLRWLRKATSKAEVDQLEDDTALPVQRHDEKPAKKPCAEPGRMTHLIQTLYP